MNVNTKEKKEVKMYPDFFKAIISENKSMEIRKNTSDFQVNDVLIFKEYEPSTGYTGNEQERIVTYTSTDGQMPGYILLELTPLDAAKR